MTTTPPSGSGIACSRLAWASTLMGSQGPLTSSFSFIDIVNVFSWRLPLCWKGKEKEKTQTLPPVTYVQEERGGWKREEYNHTHINKLNQLLISHQPFEYYKAK